MKIDIIRTTRSARDSITLFFNRSQIPHEILPGQHGLFAFNIDNQIIRRTYSFHSSAYLNEDPAITIKAVPGGVVSNYLVQHGTAHVELEGVGGDFILEPEPERVRHLIMFAAGSGITPLFAMIKSILEIERTSRITLIYSNKTFDHILFREELAELERRSNARLKVLNIITGEHAVIPADFPVFYYSRLSKLVIRKLVRDAISTTPIDQLYFYLCGPYDFMHSIDQVLQAMTIDPSRVIKEHFFIPDSEADQPEQHLPRTIIIQTPTGETPVLVPAGSAILESLIAQDIKAPYSCRAGQCGTCRAFVITGNVKMRKNHILTDAEVAKGLTLLCQAHPMSDDVVIAVQTELPETV